MGAQDDNSGQQSDTGSTEQESASGTVAPRLDLLVDEHEEEVSENGRTVRHRGIYLLPNLFTTAALFAGFYAIISAMRGDFENAAIAIFIAMLLDGLDGRIARLTNTSSKFGEEFDSLSDMVSFGVAPALVVPGSPVRPPPRYWPARSGCVTTLAWWEMICRASCLSL